MQFIIAIPIVNNFLKDGPKKLEELLNEHFVTQKGVLVSYLLGKGNKMDGWHGTIKKKTISTKKTPKTIEFMLYILPHTRGVGGGGVF